MSGVERLPRAMGNCNKGVPRNSPGNNELLLARQLHDCQFIAGFHGNSSGELWLEFWHLNHSQPIHC